MLSLNIKIFGAQSVAARLAQFPKETQAAALKAMKDSLALVEGRVKEKLSGQVLKVRTGRLRSSIGGDGGEGTRKITQDAGTTVGIIGTRVKYARIHEFGGTIHIPDIFPRGKEALRFMMGGKEVFAKKVKAHDVRMPARPYFGPSLEESKDRILRIFGTTIQELTRRLSQGGGQT